jgi:hypothetical protein
MWRMTFLVSFVRIATHLAEIGLPAPRAIPALRRHA